MDQKASLSIVNDADDKRITAVSSLISGRDKLRVVAVLNRYKDQARKSETATATRTPTHSSQRPKSSPRFRISQKPQSSAELTIQQLHKILVKQKSAAKQQQAKSRQELESLI